MLYIIGGEKRQCLIDDEEAPAAMRSSGDTVEVRDGSLWYLGREDDQVKRHGKRINLLQLNEVGCRVGTALVITVCWPLCCGHIMNEHWYDIAGLHANRRCEKLCVHGEGRETLSCHTAGTGSIIQSCRR